MNTEDSEFERIEREIKTRALPDAIHHTDISETLEYIQGWNDCRAAMLAEQPEHHDPIGDAQALLIAEQAAQAQQEPPTNKYNDKRIAWELERTAMGDGYYGNALYVAMDMPQVTAADKAMLHRYMHGSNTKTDHVKLQDLAMRVYTTPQAPKENQS